MASLAGADLTDLVTEPLRETQPLDRFATVRKAHFHLDQDTSVEIDLHAVSERDDGTDLMLEVKDWKREVTADVVRRFVETQEALAGHLERKTVFLFYSERGLGEKPAAMLHEAGILILDAAKLASYEMPAGL